MNSPLAFTDEEILSSSDLASYTFAIRHSREIPAYYELAIEDERGSLAHWALSRPLKQLARRPVLLWLLGASPSVSSLACIETGPMQLDSPRPGTRVALRHELAQGVLRLHLHGRLLRGYYRLNCLPTGCGKFWQLAPVGQA